jgi:hypothetical protein
LRLFLINLAFFNYLDENGASSHVLH